MKENNKYEILTDNGFKDFNGIINNGIRQIVEITTGNKNTIKATKDHKFIINGSITAISDMVVGDSIKMEFGEDIITEINNVGSETVYDLLEVKDGHKFISNGFVTFNCDELAFVKNHIQFEFWDSIYPTLSCLRGDTLLLTNSGLQRIEEMFNDKYEISKTLEYTGVNELYTHMGIFKPTSAYVSPPSKTLIITTDSGRELEVTKHHPIMKLCEGGVLTRADALNVGDFVRIDYGTNLYGDTSVKVGNAYNIGYNVPCDSHGLSRDILSFDVASMQYFLSGFIDGSMNPDRKLLISKVFQNYSVVSEFQQLFQNVGIHVSIRKKLWGGYNIIIFKHQWLRIFQKLSVVEKQQHIIAGLDARYYKMSPLLSIPNTQELRQLIKISIGSTGKSEQWYKAHGCKIHDALKVWNGRINKMDVYSFVSLVDINELNITSYNYNILQELITFGVAWEKIKHVQSSYCERTYDFTIPESSTFLQNGIMGSNTGGACIISSTPNGSVDLFAKLWKQQEAGVGEFKGMYVPWDAPPGRDEEFKQNKIDTLGLTKWKQEFECKFLSSDGTLIDTEFLTEYEKGIFGVKPEFTIDEQVFWKKIHPEKTYIIACDPATDSGEDFSAIQAFEFPSMVQVMEFRNSKISSKFLYAKLKQIVNFFQEHGKEVYFSIERNGIGEGTIALYDNDDSPPEATFVSEYGKTTLGLTTSNSSKLKACFRLKDMLEGGQMTINSEILIREMKSYTRQGQTYKAQFGATDDCISACLIIMRILEEMATYDSNAYMKLYGFEEEKEWEPDADSIDDNPLPFVF